MNGGIKSNFSLESVYGLTSSNGNAILREVPPHLDELKA
jgi:hypothetical protein